MLGTLRVTGNDSVVTRFRTRRVALLLAYLAFFRNRLHFRDEVGEMLWPEQDGEVIRRNLRQALTSLRHVVEPPPIQAGSILLVPQAGLQFNPDLVSTDVADFEQAIAEARRKPTLAEQAAPLRRAIELYNGELLPGYHEDWISRERLRLDDLFVFALRRLIEYSAQVQAPEDAIQYLRIALEREPYNEEWHVALMRQYLETDRPSAALQQYNELREQLDENLGADPGPEADKLLEIAQDRIARNITAPPRPIVVETPEAPPFAEPLQDEPPVRIARLPVMLTRFCGRTDEIEYTLGHLLRRNARLTSLIGPAGTGKTRLSVEVGHRLAETGDWNVWFVPLADLSNGTMVLDAVLDALKVRKSHPSDPIDQLREAVRDHENNLLILDNLEHIVEEATPIIAEIVQRVPNLRLLVTSRHVLKLEAEHQISLSPLPFPIENLAMNPVERDELAQLATYPSIQLFIDRCQTVRPDFQLTLNNARAVATICAKLEGVPLAIELAAGLSSSFAPAQMVLHLQKRLTSLASRRRDMPARHRTLRAAIDYSYDTLNPDLRRFFAALAVFRGGFSVDAAYEVCYREFIEAPTAGRRQPQEHCLDLILGLQERSLLRSEDSEETELRFRMLESFREYAEEHLSDDDFRSLRRRHADYYQARPPRVDYPLSAEERTLRHLWIEGEFDNYIAALGCRFDAGEFGQCIGLLSTLSTTWTSRGPRVIERSFIRQIADRSETRTIDPSAQIMLLRMLGTTYIRSLEYGAAYRVCEKALEIAIANDLQEGIAICHAALSTCSGYLGNLDECLMRSQMALEAAPKDSWMLIARAHLGIGAVHWGRAEFVVAESEYRLAAEFSARANGGEPDTHILNNLARVCLDTGRYDEAMTRLGESRRICRRIHDEFGMASCLTLIARYHWLKGNLNGAIATSHEALLRYRESDFSHFSLVGIFQHALILADTGEWESAAILLAATQGIGKTARLPDDRDHEAAVVKIREKCSSACFERAWAKGLGMDTDEAFRVALRFK